MTEGQLIAETLAGMTIEKAFSYLETHNIQYEEGEHSGHEFEPYLLVFPDGSGLMVSLPDGSLWEDNDVVAAYRSLTENEVSEFVVY